MKVISIKTQNKPSSRIVSIFVLGYIFLVFIIGVYFLVRDNLLTQWETLTAKIEVPGTNFVYSYVYNGKEYYGKFLGWHSSDEETNERFIARHPAGSQVLIKVNKADPYHSKVVQDFFSENFMGLIFATFGLLLLLPMFLSSIKSR